MDIKEHIDFWIKSADEDLESALINYNAHRYNWCLFIGHLALEKLLKSLFVKNNNNSLPPKIHDLIKLSNLANINIDEEIKQFFFRLNKFNLEARYPDYKNQMAQIASQDFTYETLTKIKEVYKWLKLMIK